MTINVLPRQPMPSHPRRRDGRVPLPDPEERVRLRRASYAAFLSGLAYGLCGSSWRS
ncbi:hypothetical protein [Streptomyces acidiscabies]|uniref:hypothetical protein n=1 Tax=Streptomyces acidiscabies TaxID=42234 RepID=UPI00131C27EE|nr:hypothetical protein [Streptomyces acidiscabies]